MIALGLWILATLDAAFAGYRAAAGRNGLIRKRRYYLRAMVLGAIFGQVAVALAAGIILITLTLTPDRLGAEVVVDLGRPLPGPSALGEDEDILAHSEGLDRPADDLLGMTEAVDRCRLDPGDPGIDRVPDRGDRLVIVGRAPAELPGPAGGPASEAEGGDLRSL